MVSELRPWIGLGVGLLAIVGAAWVFDRAIAAWAGRKRVDDDDRDQARRRAVSGAAFAFQQVFDPGIEHVLRAERDASSEEADPTGGDDDGPPIASLQAELLSLLTSTPVEIESIRNVLTAVDRGGHDWRALYEETALAVAEDRPYLAPVIPQPARVAPRGL